LATGSIVALMEKAGRVAQPIPPVRPVEATADAQPYTPSAVLLYVSTVRGAPFSEQLSLSPVRAPYPKAPLARYTL